MSLTNGRIFCCSKNKALINNLCALINNLGKQAEQNFIDSFKILCIIIYDLVISTKKKKNPNVIHRNPSGLKFRQLFWAGF